MATVIDDGRRLRRDVVDAIVDMIEVSVSCGSDVGAIDRVWMRHRHRHRYRVSVAAAVQ